MNKTAQGIALIGECMIELRREPAHLNYRFGGDTLNTAIYLARQLDAVLAVAGIRAFRRAVVAYEPVWAIGTGKNASPEQAEAVHAFIRDRIASQDATIAAALRLLYGGSVKAANAAEIFAQPNVDGGLVGGASLKADEFLRICAASG